MNYDSLILKKKDKTAQNPIVSVPYSKSISNRLLIIRHLSDSKAEIKNLSSSDDTIMLQNFIQSIANKTNNSFYCKNAGTTLRFLLALLSLTEGKWILDADKRMQTRPLLPLIDALNNLGADIKIKNSEEVFPITIIGKTLTGNKTIELKDNLTSQIISALILISPYIKGGVNLILPPNQVSLPYITMTVSLVNRFGGDINQIDNTLVCRQSEYKFKETSVEGDFSSAAFFYLYVAVGKIKNLRIKNLQTSYLQGDSICKDLFSQLGVETKFDGNGALLSYNEDLVSANQQYEFDLKDFPDLFCPLVVACFVSGKATLIKNLASLRVKESDRLQNMINELNKINNRCKEGNDYLIIEPQLTDNYFELYKEENVFFNTYNDHRIAMSLSAFSLVCNEITLENPACVEKSFPDFWQQISKI
ncbi:MAG: hypothetical protein IJ759_07485 [Bacteroidales bacterium]|nr:hypothetical protein [Bacteroidales bacterium]